MIIVDSLIIDIKYKTCNGLYYYNHYNSQYKFQLYHILIQNSKSINLMHQQKSICHQPQNAVSKPITLGITSKKKFQNVQKLSTLVRQLQNNSNNKPAQPEQVLQLIKQKIKNNYNALYQEYDNNKQEILRNIQQTEANEANQGNVRVKLENVLKEKNKYDKLKVEVQNKRKKLRKLMDVKQQVLANQGCTDILKQQLQDRIQLISLLQNHRSVLDYETAILLQMKKQRNLVKLNLKQRHQTMLSENQIKNEKIKRMKDTLHTKKILLAHIEQKIATQEECEIPMSLAQQLEKKLQEYQGKYIQQNILLHEKVLSAQKSHQAYLQHQAQVQLAQTLKQRKQKEQKIEYEIAFNHYLIKQTEQQQIKRLCRVENISEIANGSLEDEKMGLEQIRADVERQIAWLDEQNKKIKEEIEVVMNSLGDRYCYTEGSGNSHGLRDSCMNTCTNSNYNTTHPHNSQKQILKPNNRPQLQVLSKPTDAQLPPQFHPQLQSQSASLLDLQKQLAQQQSQLRRLKSHANKKQNVLIQWQSILQLVGSLNGKIERNNMVDILKSSISKYEVYSKREKEQQNGDKNPTCSRYPQTQSSGSQAQTIPIAHTCSTTFQKKKSKSKLSTVSNNSRSQIPMHSQLNQPTQKSSPNNQNLMQVGQNQNSLLGTRNGSKQSQSANIFSRQHIRNQSSSLDGDELLDF